MSSAIAAAPFHAFEGCPTFFYACCREASQGGPDWSYSHPGWHLAHNLARLVPYESSESEWFADIEVLEQLLLVHDDRGALKWFVTRLPRCMALVPSRRRDAFLTGVRSKVEEDGCLV